MEVGCATCENFLLIVADITQSVLIPIPDTLL